ncbi:MAG TPA: hypothetical protein VFS09_04205 [Candidatus Eisenbacteria bacterium]|nr:hypothetical protein [Candidatus Eisenbacteria bacterium]
MPQRVAWRTAARPVVILVGLAALLAACAKEPVAVDRNRPPRTYLVSAPPESGSFSYRIHLYWRGEDPDGYVVGYQWAWDDSSINAFHFTTKTDTIFELAVNDSATITGGNTNQPPGTSKGHTFFIRAVDNLGKPDPNLAVFNRRIIISTTVKPTVAFKPPLPGPGPGVDSLCDGQPFEVCWGGSDPDGSILGYKFDVGSYSSPIVRDSCVSFNDANNPNSIALASGLYTLTVQSVDNAYALSDPGASKFLFVVNRDPVTWFKDASGGRGIPVGYYIAPYLRGQLVPPTIRQFAPGDTVPYRSTVWWQWDGEDNACDSPSGINAFSLSGQVYHNGNVPYIIGFLPEIAPGIPFKTNDPVVLGQNNFSNLILDSLDAGNGILMRVRARDLSNRISGLQYSGEFTFNCNFPPKLKNFRVCDACSLGQKWKRFEWDAEDEEDGFPAEATLYLENGLDTRTVLGPNFFYIPERVFRDFSPTNPHVAEVRVKDRAGYASAERLKVTFNVDYVDTLCNFPNAPCP